MSTHGSDTGSTPPMACAVAGPPGTIEHELLITGGDHVVVDAAGNVIYTTANGIVKLDANFNRVFAFPYGSFVAVDRAGDVFVAGSFTSPIDLGAGEMQPMGNIDVFIAKLSPSGELIFAKQLGLCGDGIEGFAVDASGRIAVSGTALGTVVLDASGDVEFQVAFSGLAAFSNSDLVVAGSFAGTIDFGGGHTLSTTGANDFDGFLVKLDASGNFAFSVQFGEAPSPVVVGYDDGFYNSPNDQRVTAIATDATGEIAVIGTYYREMGLFGTTLTNVPSVIEAPPPLGGFVAKLEPAAGAPRYTGSFNDMLEMNDVALDGFGNVIVSAGVLGHVFNGIYPLLDDTSSAGGFVYGGNIVAGHAGGVAADACGNVFWVEHAARSSANGIVIDDILREFAP